MNGWPHFANPGWLLLLLALPLLAFRHHAAGAQGSLAGTSIDSAGNLNLVFSTPEGDYLKPDSITAKVCLLANKAGLKGASLH